MPLYTHDRTPITGGILIATLLLSYSSGATENIEKVTVVGSRIPVTQHNVSASMSVITAAEIKRSGALNLSDILKGMPGVAISRSGTVGALTEIRVRGSESNHLLVVLDGIIINDDSQGGLIDLAHVNLNDVSRIELLRGPQAAVWGSGAVGGVLNIQTHSANSMSGRTSAAISLGNKHTQQAWLNLSQSKGTHKFATSVQHFQSDGDNIARLDGEEDGYKRNVVNTHYYFTGKRIKTDAALRIADFTSDYDRIDFVTTGLPADADNFTEGDQASARINLTFSPASSKYATDLTATFSRNQNTNTENGQFTGSSTAERYQLTSSHRFKLESADLVFGAEYGQRLFQQRGLVTFADPNQTQDEQTTSAFLESLLELPQNIHFTLGARFDHNSEYEDAVSYRGGINWKLNQHFTAFVSSGRAIKNPTFTERFGYFPATFIGNPSLIPEKSNEWEFGLKAMSDSSLQGQISVFKAKLEDEILGFVFDPTSGLMTAKNTGSDSERSGLDSELSWHWGTFNWRASYSYLDTKQETDFGIQEELRRPRHSGGVTVTGALTDDLAVYLKWAYTGSQTDVYFPPPNFSSTTVPLRPYSLLSFNMIYDFTPFWQASVRIQNALDEEYEDIVGFSGEPRSVLFTVTYNLAQ